MLREINKDYVNLNLVEVVRPIETDRIVTGYQIILISGRNYTVSKKVGDSIRLAMNASSTTVVGNAAKKKSDKSLQEVLQMAKAVNNPLKGMLK
jgi:hypothetical protein